MNTPPHSAPTTAPAAEVAHRWGGVFVADCGARGGIRVAPDEARVTCPDCLAHPADPALWADRDQFAAAIREVTR